LEGLPRGRELAPDQSSWISQKSVAARRDIPASKKSKLRLLFGKLELCYTSTHCHAQLGTFVTVTRYTRTNSLKNRIPP
jgi:hypothetical protein